MVRVAFLFWFSILLVVRASGQESAVMLSGKGATFPKPLYERWFRTFNHKFPSIAFHYDAVGSGAGVEALLANQVDFAASDVLPSLEHLRAQPFKIQVVPAVIGAVVPVYHIQNLTQDIRFTPEVLAEIFLGQIRKWDDPKLKAINHGVPLPNRAIAVVHRSDPSGTTYIWTDFLGKANDGWNNSIGRGQTVNWPVGIGAAQNQGLAEIIEKTPDSIGYVEFIYALQNRLSYGFVRNRANQFVQADERSLQAAALTAGSVTGEFPVSMSASDARDAYPIASFTYLLVKWDPASLEKRRAMNAFLRWMLTIGQKECAALGYVPLPSSIAADTLGHLPVP